MKRQRHTPEQIIRKLREADRLLGRRQGSPRGGQGARGLRADLPPLASPLRRDEGRRHAKRLKELERENARLKRIVADKELEADALRERAGKLLSPSRRRRGVLALRERLGLSERRACQRSGGCVLGVLLRAQQMAADRAWPAAGRRRGPRRSLFVVWRFVEGEGCGDWSGSDTMSARMLYQATEEMLPDRRSARPPASIHDASGDKLTLGRGRGSFRG